MQILILGYSQIARRRVIPALSAISDFTGIDLASERSAGKVSLPKKISGEIYDSYHQALSRSKADLVYISTVNSTHNELARAALDKGFHVIVDKPAFTGLTESEELLNLARKNNLCLAEATVYAYHPQVKKIQEFFLERNSQPKRLSATFSFPSLAADNFRYKKSLGGGILYDLGPYAVSCGRLFFKQEPEAINCFINSYGGQDNLETSFSMLAKYSNRRSMVGHFGFGTEYRNSITVLGSEGCLELERIFTIPAQMENELKVIANNERSTIKVPKADCFGLFLGKVLESINKKDYSDFYNNLISDASVLKRLRQAANSAKSD